MCYELQSSVGSYSWLGVHQIKSDTSAYWVMCRWSVISEIFPQILYSKDRSSFVRNEKLSSVLLMLYLDEIQRNRMAGWNKKYCALVLLLAIGSIKCSEHKSDKYVTSSKAECLSSKSLFSCVKYKSARFIWSLAIGRVQLDKLFNSERFNLVKIASDEEDNEFPEYRYDQGILIV